MTPLRLLITGINGLIGTILKTALHDAHDLYGLDRVGPFSEQVLSADIFEYQQVAGVVERFSPLDGIIHLAGNPHVKASWDEVLSANIVGTRNVFEAARAYHIPRVIFASSNHVTGAYEGFEPDLYLHAQSEPRKISVADPIRPDSEYGVSKALIEKSLTTNMTFGIYYGVSNNKGGFWDITNARTDLGYHPLDDASTR